MTVFVDRMLSDHNMLETKYVSVSAGTRKSEIKTGTNTNRIQSRMKLC
jgi:hypothetical protein